MLFCYYGRMGTGKTYAMTRDVVSDLNRGKVVYANYRIDWNGYDESKYLWFRFLHLFGRPFRCFPSSNLRRFSSVEQIKTIRNCVLALDEGYLYFDSYLKTSLKLGLRQAVLFARKHGVEIRYTTQRTSAVHVVMRSMTNVFYKLVKYKLPWGMLFVRYEYDLDSNENVDENKSYGVKMYMGDERLYGLYDTLGEVFIDEAV